MRARLTLRSVGRFDVDESSKRRVELRAGGRQVGEVSTGKGGLNSEMSWLLFWIPICT